MISEKEKNFVSAVFYIHNSEAEIGGILPDVFSLFEENFENFEIICVNDASTDNSKKKIEEFSKEKNTSAISIINMSTYHGTELSMNAGVDLAIGDFVFEFDTLIHDYDTDLIMDIYRKALEGYDIVSGAPDFTSEKTSRLFYFLYNKYATSKQLIQHERIRVISRRAINRVKAMNMTILYRKSVYANCGLNRFTVYYHRDGSKHPRDRQERENRLETAIDSMILFTDFVQKISLYISLLFGGIAVITGIYGVVSYIGGMLGIHRPVEGWTPLILFLSIGFFGVFLVLTIILWYLAVILKLIFKKKYYLIESVEKLTNN